MLWVRLRIGDGRGVSASVDVIFGDGVGETRLNSLLLSNTAAAASSHVGIGGSCGGHGVESSIGVGAVIRVVGDCCKGVDVSFVVGVAGDGIDESRLSSLLLLKTMLAASSHVGIGGSVFTGVKCVNTVVVVAGWAVAGRWGVGTKVVDVGGFSGVNVVEVVVVAALHLSSSWLHIRCRASIKVAAHTFLKR